MTLSPREIVPCLGHECFGMQGLCVVQRLGFGARDTLLTRDIALCLGSRVQDPGFRVRGLGFRVYGSGFNVQGSSDAFAARNRPLFGGWDWGVRFRVRGEGRR